MKTLIVIAFSLAQLSLFGAQVGTNLVVTQNGTRGTVGTYPKFNVNATNAANVIDGNLKDESATGLILTFNTNSIAPNAESPLHLGGRDSANSFLTIDGFGTAVRPGMWTRLARGTLAAPTPPLSQDTLGVWRASGWDGASFTAVRGGINVHASETWTTTNTGTALAFSVTPNSSTTINSVAALLANNRAFAVGGTLTSATIPAAMITSESATLPQLILYYDPTHLLTITVDASGNVSVVPSGGAIVVTGTVSSTYQRFGSGDPNSVVSAPVGAIYSRTDGGAGSTLYVKEGGGSGNTGWAAK